MIAWLDQDAVGEVSYEHGDEPERCEDEDD